MFRIPVLLFEEALELEEEQSELSRPAVSLVVVPAPWIGVLAAELEAMAGEAWLSKVPEQEALGQSSLTLPGASGNETPDRSCRQDKTRRATLSPFPEVFPRKRTASGPSVANGNLEPLVLCL